MDARPFLRLLNSTKKMRPVRGIIKSLGTWNASALTYLGIDHFDRYSTKKYGKKRSCKVRNLSVPH